MKNVIYIKNKKIFGIPYYQKILVNNKTIRRYFMGLYSSIHTKFFKMHYLFSKQLDKKNIRFNVCKFILDKISEPCDDIFVLVNATGETFFFLYILETIIKKFQSKSPVLIINNKQQEALCKMFAPNYKYYIIPESLQLSGVKSIVLNIFEHRFIISLPFYHYYDWHKKIISDKNLHYYTSFLKEFEINSTDIKEKQPYISDEVKEQCLQKVKDIGLNLDNFIFISPDARSNPTLDYSFWNELTLKLKNMGYDLFYNTYIHNITPRTEKSCFLTKEEVQYLCSISKGIIGIKSGLIEPLLLIKTIPIVTIYTPMYIRCNNLLPYTPAEIHMRACTCLKCPVGNIQNIYEFNAELIDQEDLIKNIENIFKK